MPITSPQKIQTDQGLVLRRTRHLENDVKLTLLLKNIGKVFVVAKTAGRLNSKLKSLVEPFSKSDFQIYLPPHGANSRLISGKLIDSHHDLRLNYQAFQVACQSCETVESLVPFRAPAQDVFDLLDVTLKRLEKNPHPKFEWIFFVVRILNVLGHGDITKKLPAPLSETSPEMNRILAYVNAQLQRVLPWKLQSDVFHPTLQ